MTYWGLSYFIKREFGNPEFTFFMFLRIVIEPISIVAGEGLSMGPNDEGGVASRSTVGLMGLPHLLVYAALALRPPPVDAA